MLATDLVATAPPGILVGALARRELDITDAAAVARALARYRPKWVINAAAYTNVDGAEKDYATAHAVNADAVSTLGSLCAEGGIAVLHYSSDYVFSGAAASPYTESDSTAPVNAYGRTKLAGEEGLLASGARALVLRAQWLFGTAGRSFPRTMQERATRNLMTRVVDDQFGRPTSTVDLAEASWALVDREATGLYHVANDGVASWFDVAELVFRTHGSNMLQRCATSEYPTPARRPAFSVLDTTKAAREHGIRLPHWTESLARFMRSTAAPVSATQA